MIIKIDLVVKRNNDVTCKPVFPQNSLKFFSIELENLLIYITLRELTVQAVQGEVKIILVSNKDH